MRASISKRFLGAALAATAVAGAFGGVASASTVPPVASASLIRTWVNTNPNTNSVRQIVVQSNGAGGVLVDAFGACSPTSCEWGAVPGIVYAPNVSTTTGTAFQTNQAFYSGGVEWSRTALQAQMTTTIFGGLQLNVTELTVFEDGSGRHNYKVNETFVPGADAAIRVKGISAAGYPIGLPPAPVSGLYGTWKNTSASPAVAQLVISASGSTPVVHAYGACTPTYCDMGSVRGITYGSSISSLTGDTVLAPYSFGFKNEQLTIVYTRGADGVERLTVRNHNEFTDGSGRSNYVMTETFVRAA